MYDHNLILGVKLDLKHQVVCMKWGQKFTADYVNILYSMVRRNLSGPLRFVCLTDDSTSIRPEVECQPCPELPIKHANKNLGWRKLTLWKDKLAGMEGQWLFLDLDVVIVDSIEDFFSWKPTADFVVMENATQAGQGIGNTSVFRFKVGSHPYLYDQLVESPDDVITHYPNSQTYVSKEIKNINWWQDDWCKLFKVHCVPKMPNRWWKEPGIPPKSKIIAFPGVPNPPEARDGKWPAKWYKRVYKFIKPTSWIDQYWKDDG